MMHIVLATARFLVEVALTVVEAACWCVRGIVQTTLMLVDVVRARRATRSGTLRCPEGHDVPTEGGVYECQTCRFTYRGSLLQCGNVECGAITPYVNCPVCGLSCRNPYRYGRP